MPDFIYNLCSLTQSVCTLLQLGRFQASGGSILHSSRFVKALWNQVAAFPNQERHRVDKRGPCTPLVDAVSIATFQTFLYCLPQERKDAEAAETRPENHHVVEASMLFGFTGRIKRITSVSGINLITCDLFTARCVTRGPCSRTWHKQKVQTGLQPVILLIICTFVA